MNASTVMLILNLIFVAVIVIGFLFGLKGAKKSALSLGFFIGALCLSLILTPVVTKSLLMISFTYDGQVMPIKDIIITALKENATIKELSSNGSNTEALIQNMPQMLGNLATFMILLIVIGFIFWIAYLITAHFVFKKDKANKKEKNPVSKTAPSYVSATGNVTYVREPKKQSKHRLGGGLIGALHALIFVVAFLIPVCGTARLFNQFAYSTDEEVSTTTVVTLLDVSADGNNQTEETSPNYTPSAKLIQENFPKELLDLSNCIDKSIIGNICGIVNTNNYIYNGLAKCDVNGEKIVLTKEVNSVITIYDNVEFLNSIDFNSAESLRTINFNKLRKAINTLTDSSILKSVAPEVTIKYLDWITREDISDLDPALVESLTSIRQQLDEQPNLKELVIEIQKLLSDKKTVVSTLKQELLNLVDIAEIAINSDLVNEIVKEQPDTKNIITILHANNNQLMNTLIDKLYESDFVNLGTLTMINYGIDAIQADMDEELKDEAVKISKIVLSEAKGNLDSDFVKSATNFAFELYLNTEDCTNEKDELDIVKFVETYGKTTVDNFASILDDIKNMTVLEQFDVLTNLITNAKKLTVQKATEDEPEKKLSSFVNLDYFLDKTYSFKDDLKNLSKMLDNATKITFIEGEGADQKTITLVEKVINGDVIDALKQLDKEQLSSILKPASETNFIKPLVNTIVEKLNKTVSDSVSEVGDLLPPDIDVADHIDEIIDVVDSVNDVLPILDKMDSLDNNKTLSENLKEQLDDDEKNSIASLLETLQENANNDGVFKDAYTNLVETAKDDSKSGLDGLAEIVEKNTTTDGETTIIDWQAIINEYLKNNA